MNDHVFTQPEVRAISVARMVQIMRHHRLHRIEHRGELAEAVLAAIGEHHDGAQPQRVGQEIEDLL